MILNLLLVLCSFFFVGSANPDLVETYKSLENKWEDNLYHSNYHNLDGFIAWDESYLMTSYLEMYEKTDEISYLHKLAARIEDALSQRDDITGRTDYRNLSSAVWTSTKYTNNRPYAWIVHSGMITYPIVKFAYLILQNEHMHDYRAENCDNVFIDLTFHQIAKYLVLEVEKTVKAHDDQWDDDYGAYRFRNDKLAVKYFGQAGKILPHNQQSAMGRTLIYLYLTTGNGEYFQKANCIGEYIKSKFFDYRNYSYAWSYSDEKTIGEDISHAAVNVGFAYECFKNDIVFTKGDLIRISNTVRHNIFKSAHRTSRNVDGSGKSNEYQLQLGRWLYLAEVDPNLSHLVLNLFSEYLHGGKSFVPENGETLGSIMLGLSLLIKYYDATDSFSNYFNVYSANKCIEIRFRRMFISPISIELVSIDGKIIFSKTLQYADETSVISISCLNFKPSVYLLVLQTLSFSTSEKILIP